MKILVTGSTGLVGTALTQSLKNTEHTVCRLIRPGTAAESVSSSEGFRRQLGSGNRPRWAAQLSGAEAAVNLAGAPIAEGRSSAQRKMMIRASRVRTTRSLVAALAKMAIRPRVLVSASAIGYYGNRGDELLNEGSGPGADFLSEIARDWEAEAQKAEVAWHSRGVCPVRNYSVEKWRRAAENGQAL